MAAKRQPKNTWLLILSGIIALAITGGIVALNEFGAPINGVIRIAALFGYLGIFLTSLASNYARELTRYFGRQFIQVHHYVATASLIALVLHATLVAWRAGSASVFVPQVSSVLAFLSMGGVVALWLLVITVVTAILRTAIGKNWKTIHWLNYVAFILATIHGQLIGTDFDGIAIQLISTVMVLILIFVFVWKRTRKRRALAKTAKKKREANQQ